MTSIFRKADESRFEHSSSEYEFDVTVLTATNIEIWNDSSETRLGAGGFIRHSVALYRIDRTYRLGAMVLKVN